MLVVRGLRDAMVLVARAQTLLRETRDARAVTEADLLEERLVALGRVLEESSGK